jgi:RHS repeat-associated protein
VLGRYPTGGLVAFFVTDGAGRQYAVLDRNGVDIRSRIEYTQEGGKYAGGTANAMSFGAERNPSAEVPGVSFFRNRIYDQRSGRWTQEDPIGVAGGLNLYQFNRNNPVAYTDPFGLCPIEKDGVPCTLTMAATGLVGGAFSGAVVGGSGGTLVVPGVGTIAGGGSGALVGGTAGLTAGGLVGAARDATSIVEMSGLGETLQRKVGRLSRRLG